METPVTITAPMDAPFQTLIATAFDGVIMTDTKGRIQVFNTACEQIFGYSVEEIAGKNVKMLMPSPHRGQHDGFLARHRATGESRIIGVGRKAVGRRKDGS